MTQIATYGLSLRPNNLTREGERMEEKKDETKRFNLEQLNEISDSMLEIIGDANTNFNNARNHSQLTPEETVALSEVFITAAQLTETLASLMNFCTLQKQQTKSGLTSGKSSRPPGH